MLCKNYMSAYKHLFFDMDQTITPARQPLLDEMATLLRKLPNDVVVVSGSTTEQIKRQVPDVNVYKLGQSGNHALDHQDQELWWHPLEDHYRAEINAHIEEIIKLLDHDLNHEWTPIEDRGAQITFSPIGNTAPVEIKRGYDSDRSKRKAWMEQVPFISKDLVVKIGGSTSFDYIHKDRHKGTNVAKLIERMGWNKDECIYFGDGLYPGGNDEAVIGVIETVLVEDHHDTYRKLREIL